MPRIDPLQLLNCLQVLLSPTTGGILSINEVQRLASLMTKFSKKLVSKCVYILILKNTERQLLGNFMAVGGWTLLQVWLQDAMCNSNWALVKELLDLVLITPVDVERLKSNNIPKLVKSLSKREELNGIYELSNKLVQQWLKIVKQETNADIVNQQLNHCQNIPQIQQGMKQSTERDKVDHPPPPFEVVEVPVVQVEQHTEDTNEDISLVDGSAVLDDSDVIDTQTFYKLSVRDGKQVLSKVNRSEANCMVVENAIIEEVDVEDQTSNKVSEHENKDKVMKDAKEKENREEKRKDRSEKSNSSSSKSADKYKSSSKDSPRSKDRHKSSSRDKDRNHKDRRDRDGKHRHNGEIKSSSKSSKSKDKDRKESSKKDTKEKQAEKDKDTLAKVQPQSITKLPKIPKKTTDSSSSGSGDSSSSSNSKDAKKGSISIEVRKAEERPKTVKVFNAKMRSTGLEEEAKPPPPRPTKKPTTTLPTIPPPQPHKRPSPTRDVITIAHPPEKKSKIDPAAAERPGSIKLIPPKPKPVFLQESDMFMDALTASASSKKEPKKRRRRPSTSKDSSSPPISPSTTQASTGPTEPSSMALRNITPPKFYQDTLESEDGEENKKESDNDSLNTSKTEETEMEETQRAATPTDSNQEMEAEEQVVQKNANGLKGVLLYSKRKGPKKSIRWKSDDELVQVQYFELDENERVNVTKTFGDLAKFDVKCEREALQMSRKLPNEDLMDVQTPWRIPWEIELDKPLAEPGSKSVEKEVQFAREKSVLQALYFHRAMIPDSPAEPDPENYQITDPVVIPIEAPDDPDHDYRNTPWPEPKGSPPPQNLPNIPQVFPKMANNFQNFGIGQPPQTNNMPQQQPPQPPFVPPPSGFIPPNVMPPSTEWNNLNNHQLIVPNIPPPDIMSQGPLNPNLGFVPGPAHGGPGPGHMPDNFNHHPIMKDNPPVGFPPLFNQPRMFPPNFRGHGDHHGPHRGFRRGGGNGPWVRMNGPNPGNWNHMRGAHRGSHVPTRLCKNVRQHGYCRNRDNCSFFHPN